MWKNKLLLYQLNKGASVIYLEKHGAQVCKEQKWVCQGQLTPGIPCPEEPNTWDLVQGVSVGLGSGGSGTDRNWMSQAKHSPQLAQKAP